MVNLYVSSFCMATSRVNLVSKTCHLCEAKKSFEAVGAGMKKPSKVIQIWCYK